MFTNLHLSNHKDDCKKNHKKYKEVIFGIATDLQVLTKSTAKKLNSNVCIY